MDIKIHYYEKGMGEPLVLLHGNGEDLSYFENQIKYFSKYYRVIAIDTRGHGKTPRGEKKLSIIQFAQDLYDFLNEKNIDKIHLLGFSDGGNVALCFALKHQERLKSLILNGANLNPKGVKLKFQLPIVFVYKIIKFMAGKNTILNNKAELLGLMVNEPDINPEDLKNIQIDTFVIAGKNDMIKTKHTKQIFEYLPNAELALLKGNHFIAKNCPDEYNGAVRKFLLNL